MLYNISSHSFLLLTSRTLRNHFPLESEPLPRYPRKSDLREDPELPAYKRCIHRGSFREPPSSGASLKLTSRRVWGERREAEYRGRDCEILASERVARGEISARVYDCYLYRSHVTLWVPFLILREKRYVIRKTGIIRGCFINFHPRDKSALMLAIANETDESLRRLHPLRTTLDSKNSVV